MTDETKSLLKFFALISAIAFAIYYLAWWVANSDYGH